MLHAACHVPSVMCQYVATGAKMWLKEPMYGFQGIGLAPGVMFNRPSAVLETSLLLSD